MKEQVSVVLRHQICGDFLKQPQKINIPYRCKQILLLLNHLTAMKQDTFAQLIGSDSKESACNVGDLGSIPGLRRSPRGGHGNPLQCSCLETPHGQRSLVGYSPWHPKELDMTE